MNNLSLSLAGSATKAGVGQAIMKKSAAGASLLNINEENSNNGDSPDTMTNKKLS